MDHTGIKAIEPMTLKKLLALWGERKIQYGKGTKKRKVGIPKHHQCVDPRGELMLQGENRQVWQ
jgi:hypothetical protein